MRMMQTKQDQARKSLARKRLPPKAKVEILQGSLLGKKEISLTNKSDQHSRRRYRILKQIGEGFQCQRDKAEIELGRLILELHDGVSIGPRDTSPLKDCSLSLKLL